MPLRASSRSLIRLMRNFRYTPRLRPVSSHRFSRRDENFGVLFIRANVFLLAIWFVSFEKVGAELGSAFIVLASEWESKFAEQELAHFGVALFKHNIDIHSMVERNVRHVDFGPYGLFG